MSLKVHRRNFNTLFNGPDALTWGAMVGVRTYYKLAPIYCRCTETFVDCRCHNIEDVIDLFRKRERRGRKLRNYRQFAVRWLYMIERAVELEIVYDKKVLDWYNYISKENWLRIPTKHRLEVLTAYHSSNNNDFIGWFNRQDYSNLAEEYAQNETEIWARSL